jgi:hypothetical protein
MEPFYDSCFLFTPKFTLSILGLENQNLPNFTFADFCLREFEEMLALLFFRQVYIFIKHMIRPDTRVCLSVPGNDQVLFVNSEEPVI